MSTLFFFLTKHWPSATVGTKKQNGSSTCPKHLSQTSSFLTCTNSVYKVYMIPFLSDVFPKLYIQPSNQSPTNPRCPSWSDVPLPKARLGARSVCMLGLSNPLSKKPSKKREPQFSVGFHGKGLERCHVPLSQRWSYWMKVRSRFFPIEASQAPCSTSARRNRTF